MNMTMLMMLKTTMMKLVMTSMRQPPLLTDHMFASHKHCLHPGGGGGGNSLCGRRVEGGLMHAGQKGFGWDNRVARGQCKHTHSTSQTGYHTMPCTIIPCTIMPHHSGSCHRFDGSHVCHHTLDLHHTLDPPTTSLGHPHCG